MKYIKLFESFDSDDTGQSLKRTAYEELSVSDKGELIGDIDAVKLPDEQLSKLSLYDERGDSVNIVKKHVIERFNYKKVEDSYEFGYINDSEENESVLYDFIKLDKNNGDEVYVREDMKVKDMIIIKDGYWYSLKFVGVFTLDDKNPSVMDAHSGEEVNLNDLDYFPEFIMGMIDHGIKKYYVHIDRE